MYEYLIKDVIRVVDGDTIDTLIDLGFNISIKERIRINRIDAPESNSKDVQERQLANEAKEFVAVWLVNQNKLIIKTTKDDKYGRMLGEIFNERGECLNDLILQKGYAWEYNGGEKTKDINLLLENRK